MIMGMRTDNLSFYAEKAIRDLPEYPGIANRYPDLQWIDDYQTFRQANTTQEKKCLIFARKRGSWLKPFHCYENASYRFLSLDLAEGCFFDCVYCYLQSYLNHGALVIFTDRDGLMSEISQLKSENYWISTGLLSDSLLADNQYSYLSEISRLIPSGSLLELRSKATCLDSLESDAIVREPVVISWSLNPPEIALSYEYGAAAPDERLNAAWLAIELGYRIAFHLDPIFFFDGWADAYARLFEKLNLFPKNRIAFLSVGLFRYMADLGNVIRKRFPYNPILSAEFVMDEDGKYHYFRSIRKEMYNRFTDWVKPWSGVPVFWSMEPDKSFYKQEPAFQPQQLPARDEL